MVFTLLTPKIILSSVALAHAPYWYPLTLIVEFGLILVYNRIFFGNYSCKSLSNLATLITPALFQPPRQTAQDQTKFKLVMTRYVRLGHIATFYFLPFVIYLLAALPLHMIVYTEVSLVSHSFDGFVPMVSFFLTYFGAFLLYLFLSALYYKVPNCFSLFQYFFQVLYFQFGHNWSPYIDERKETQFEMVVM